MSKIVTEETLVKQRQQGLTILSPLKLAAKNLVVKTPEQYAEADSLLTRIKGAKKSWTERINPIIEPIRAGLDLLYGLRSDIVTPLEELEKQVKDSMKAFKVEEAKQLRMAEEVRAKELEDLRRAAIEKEAREAVARTKQLRERLAAQRAVLEQSLATKEQEAPPEPIKAAGSGTRTVRKWKVVDMIRLIDHISDKYWAVTDVQVDSAERGTQEDLTALLTVDTTQMDAYFRLSKPDVGVGNWLPGVEVWDDIVIAGRRG